MVICTVDLRGLNEISRDILDTGDVDNHHISDLLPAHNSNETPERRPLCGDNRHGMLGQNAVENHQPDVRKNDTADQVRQEERRTEDICSGLMHNKGTGTCRSLSL